TGVLIFTLLGVKIKSIFERNFRRKPKLIFTAKNRKIIYLWRNYGKIGIAFLTPILLSPVVGTLIMVSFGVKRRQIYLHMLWSACLWSVVINLSIGKILAVPFVH